jgi:hypothetical protein
MPNVIYKYSERETSVIVAMRLEEGREMIWTLCSWRWREVGYKYVSQWSLNPHYLFAILVIFRKNRSVKPTIKLYPNPPRAN